MAQAAVKEEGEEMKKLFFTFMILFLCSINISFASTNVTYFYGEPIKVDNTNVEILSNELFIDIINSHVSNTFYMKNTSSETIYTILSIPIEHKDFSITANNIEIKLNGTNISFLKSNNGDYLVYTKIPGNSGKKLEISYNTDNDLNNAKIFKYNMANFEGKTIGKVNVQIKIDEKNIPLIEKIYPGHFEFDEVDNIISVEYYNYELSPITKEVIVEKETFNNLLYGKENEIDGEEREIIKKWSEGITDKKQLFGSGENIKEFGFQYGFNLPFVANIYDFIEKTYGSGYDMEIDNPILYYLYCYKSSKGLSNKTICVDFVETEGNIDLYKKYGKLVYEIENYWTEDKYELADEGIDYYNMSIEEIETIRNENLKKYFYSGDFDYFECGGFYVYDYKKYTEREFLKTIGAWPSPLNSRIIYVGEGINGEKLDASEENIIKYVNSINADMYMRVMIYDNPLKIDKYGYYSRKCCWIL